MRLTKEVIEILGVHHLDVNELCLLYTSFFNLNWELNIFPTSINKLRRLNLIKEDNSLTIIGEGLLFECLTAGKDNEEPTIVREHEVIEDKFDEIWLAYPRDDTFRNYPRSRILRTNKALTKREYEGALKRGLTHEQLLLALNNEISYRSSSERDNLLKYMKSSYNWFREEVYYDFLDSIEEEDKGNYGKELY